MPTLVGVESNDRPTKSRSRPEAACDHPVESDIEYCRAVVARQRIAGIVAGLTKVVEKPRLNVALAFVTDAPFDQLVPDFQ